MTGSKPTIILVPGAFHLHSCFDLLVAELHDAGYSTHSKTLKSVGARDISIAEDISFIREDLLRPLIEDEGKNVIVLMHSYAGVPTSVAIDGFSKKERTSKGLEGGIVGLIYVCAILVKGPVAALKTADSEWADWQTPNENTGLLTIPSPKPKFYSDVPEPLASEAAAAVQSHSMKAFTSALPPFVWSNPAYDNRRAYIHTLEDATLPLSAQHGMLHSTGVEWVVRDIQSSHSPFFSRPRELCAVLVELAEKFTLEMA